MARGNNDNIRINYSGDDPDRHLEQVRNQIKNAINETVAELETELVRNTPADTGRLRQTWSSRFADDDNLVGIVGQSSRYFLPLELGRKPGKGISRQGQESVARWGRRKLGISDGKGFAYLLSQKYKTEGRKAEGFAGLARPGDNPVSSQGEIKPVSGGIIQNNLNKLQRRLRGV